MPFGSPVVGAMLRIAMAVGLSGLGWWLWQSFVSTHPVAAYVYGFLLFAIGVLGLFVVVRDLRRPVPFAIRISDKGIMAYRGRSPDLILWSDIKGAHAAIEVSQRVSMPIIALELVDPRPFYARLDADKPKWLGPDTGLRPKYYPLASTGLDMEPEQVLLAVNEAIHRWGIANPDPLPETNYSPVFTRLPGRAAFATGLILFVALLAAPFALLGAPRWVEAADQCDVRNRFTADQWRRNSGKQWRRMHAVWTGPCVDGRAEGDGILEWFRDGVKTVRYSGRMEDGRITGRGELTENGIRYDGLWKDGVLLEGTATFPDARQYRGTWNKGEWDSGVLTMPSGKQWDGRWYAGRLTGEGSAKGRQGEFKGKWAKGVPQGAGVFVTRDGRRFEGKWQDGKPVDPEMARLQVEEDWECLWAIGLAGRYDSPSNSEPWTCRIR